MRVCPKILNMDRGIQMENNDDNYGLDDDFDDDNYGLDDDSDDDNNFNHDQAEYTVREAAERANVSEETVRRWIRARKLVSYCDSRRGGHRIKVEDFTNFLGQMNPPSYPAHAYGSVAYGTVPKGRNVPYGSQARSTAAHPRTDELNEEDDLNKIIQEISSSNINSTPISALISELNSIKEQMDEIEGRINDYRREISKCEEELGDNRKKFDVYKKSLVMIKDTELSSRSDETTAALQFETQTFKL